MSKIRFKVGESYYSVKGEIVKIIQQKYDYEDPYNTVLGDDGIWRYNRSADLGRVTGSDFFNPHPDNLLMPAITDKCCICNECNIKVLYLNLPMKLCSSKECSHVSGFWSFLINPDSFVYTLDIIRFSGFFTTYRGNYIAAVYNNLFRKQQ